MTLRRGHSAMRRGSYLSKVGTGNLWNGTPLSERFATLGAPEVILDLDEAGDLFEGVGWSWDIPKSRLCAWVDYAGKTYLIRISLAKIKEIFSRHSRRRLKSKSAVGFFDEIGKWIDGAVKDVGKEIDKVGKGVASFVNNPGKWIENAGKDVARYARDAAKIASDIASHPVFAGAMSALSVIPPLQAVGGAGLAAYAAAQKIKPALNAVEGAAGAIGKGAELINKATKKKPKKAKKKPSIKKAAANLTKAKAMVDAARNNLPFLPKKEKALVTAALKTTSPTISPNARFKFVKQGEFYNLVPA